MKRCRRGHAMTAKNSRPHRNTYSGKVYYACRRCETLLQMTKYKSDEDYRAAALARSRTYKAARRAARCEEVRA